MEKKWLFRILIGGGVLFVVVIVTAIAGFFWWSNRMENDSRPHLEYALELAQKDERVVRALGEPITLRSYGMAGSGGQLKDGSFRWAYSGMLEGPSEMNERLASAIIQLRREPSTYWRYEKIEVTVYPQEETFELELDDRRPAPVKHPFRPLIMLNESN